MADRQEMINTLVAHGNHARLIVERWDDITLQYAIELDAEQDKQWVRAQHAEMEASDEGSN
ncbi:hypothetical protein [Schleiferilactobacillus harbinensis]|uniref:Uncharacterized protein n=1 Tax=Schleiferilactobacillus harbinensis TaxID=304207 RepID=A0A5P8M753_9LACO|nr:hypothetical protein [Schleiferilactobacillus harbinensis]QFR24114.1 hypothetical protein D1010_12360 [Schleiferilactobacillus harbinensis]